MKRAVFNFMEDNEEYIVELPQQEVKTRHADVWRRAVAYLIDCVIFYFVFFQIFMLVFIPMAGIPMSEDLDVMERYIETNPSIGAKIFAGTVATSFVFLFYFMLSETILGASLGKSIMKLYVVDNEIKSITYQKAVIRNLTKTILLPLLLVDLSGLLWTNGRQRLTDSIAGTNVIYSPKLELEYEVYG
jgi:uncharacterized RDD family membrane protein YckC